MKGELINWLTGFDAHAVGAAAMQGIGENNRPRNQIRAQHNVRRVGWLRAVVFGANDDRRAALSEVRIGVGY